MGVIGNRASLPCNITPPVQDDAVALILWYKDDITKPIYSVDARKTSVEQARHVAGDAVSTRVALSLDESPSILFLEELSEEDEGEYRCRVDFKRARSRNGIVYLQLVVPPKKPIITDQNGEILESLIGPYNEGDNLHLICEAEEGKPLPSVTWWRETVLLDDTYVVTPHGVVRNELEVTSLQRHDLMAVFTCQASNNNFSIPAYAAVTVDMNFRPVSVKLDGGPRPMSAEKPVELTCRSAGSKPPAVISWWMGNVRLKHNKDTVSTDGNVTTSVLNFRPSMDDNGKQLICRAENPLIAGSALDDTWDLEIHYVPQLVLRLGSKLRHYHIQEGNDVYLECDIRANPWVTEIGWSFEGRELHTNVSAGIIISNQSLVLQRVQRYNRGHYTCTAVNSEGTGESKPLYLSVQYSPICKAGQKILYGATRHEEVQVVCEVEADPTDVSFRWSFNKSGENVEDVTFVSDGTKSTATVTAKTEYDYGTLTCWGTNSVGPQKEPCVYTVITAGPPDPVQNCSIMNRTQSSFRLECVEGSNGGLRQFFVMEVHDTLLQRLRDNQTADIPVFLARDLPSATNFVVVLYAVNAKGKSQAVVLRANTLDSRHKSLQRGGRWQVSTPVLVAALATVGTAFLVALVAIIMVRRARRRLHEEKRHMKRACETPDTLLKNGKDRNREMCLCITDEDEKPPGMTPEVVVMSEIRSHSCTKNHLYCSSELKSSSPYLGEGDSKPRQRGKKRNMFIRFHRSLSRKPQFSAPDVAQEAGQHQMRVFQSYGGGSAGSSPIERRDSILTLPPSIESTLQSSETALAEETSGVKHIITGEASCGK